MIRERLRNANLRLLPQHIVQAPEWLVLGVNNVCNLHCRMCDVGLARTDTVFARNLTGTRPLNMPLELVTEIFDEAARHWPGVRIGFAFTEPLIWPHLEVAVAAATKRGLATAVTTNGYTLSQRGPALADNGLGEIFVSLDGPAEIHDQTRGRAGSFARAVDGLACLARHPKPPRMSVHCVLTPWNLGHLRRLVESLAELPLERIGFMHPNFTTPEMAAEHNRHYGEHYRATDSNLGPLQPDQVDLDLLAAEIAVLRALRPGLPLTFSPNLSSRVELERFYRQPTEWIGRGCGDVHRTMMIKSDGSVIPAHGRCYELTIGNVKHQSLPEIWNSAEIGRLRTALVRAGGLLPACTRCCSAF